MPVYTYNCTKCNETKTQISSIAKRDEQICRVCNEELKRQIDRPGAVWSPTRNGGMTV